MLNIFYDSYGAKSQEIAGFFAEGDWENYTIKVHALKSSSRLVGALALGDAAEALEMAGKDGDIDFITSHHFAMMDQYTEVYEALKQSLGKEEELPDIPEDVLSDAYAGLTEFVRAKDYELAKMVMDSVKEYRLPAEDDERFKGLGICLSGMDWDGMNEILSGVV